MKHFLLILTIATCSQFAKGQAGIYQRDTTKAKNCFDDYYEAFVTRGALHVPDGEQNVVYSLIKDTTCVCGEAKVTVKDGYIVPYALIKKIDGTYEPAKRKLHPNTTNGESAMHPYEIFSGMSRTLLTDDFYTVNLFFVEYLKPKVVANAQAPSPNDIAGRRKVELDVKEKEIIRKAYEGLQFENGKAKIMSSSYPHLNLLAEMLKEKQDYKIELNGYTDNVGKPEANLTLSKNRAKAVSDYLVKQGVDASRITTEGFGMENPIGDNKTPAGRAKNRRVEFIIEQ